MVEFFVSSGVLVVAVLKRRSGTYWKSLMSNGMLNHSRDRRSLNVLGYSYEFWIMSFGWAYWTELGPNLESSK